MVTISHDPVELSFNQRAGDRFAHVIVVDDGGDHDRDGIAEDPDNPEPLNWAAYTFRAQIKANRWDAVAAVAMTVDPAQLAIGQLGLSLTPAQTAALLPISEQRSEKQYVWDLERTLTADTTDVLTTHAGTFTVFLDVTR